jgi:hypothetical protein
MPPKSTGKGRKKKKVEEPMVAKPEPMDCDEAEAAYLWDRIAPIKANPLDKIPTLYTYATAQAVNAGPAPHVVLGLASATVPLLSPHPPTHSTGLGQTAMTKKGGSAEGNKQQSASTLNSPSAGQKGDGNQSSAASPTSLAPMEQSALLGGDSSGSSPAGGTSFATVLRQQSSFFAPHPPARNPTVESQRTIAKVAKSENVMIELKSNLAETTSAKEDVTQAIDYEHKSRVETIKETSKTCQAEEERLKQEQFEQQRELQEQEQSFLVLRLRVQDELDDLMSREHQVLADLADKKYTLEEIASKEATLRKLIKDHSVAFEKEKVRLSDEVQKLKETMVMRLKRTVEEMEQLTQQHREKRQQRAVSESARLVAKLTALEAKSKQLTAENTKLTRQAESTKRDQQLEEERHALLQKKSQALSKDIRTISGKLQSYERQFAEKTVSASQSEEVIILSQTIDQQYQRILELKHELDAVKERSEEAEKRLAYLLQKQFLAHRAETGTSGSLVASSSPALLEGGAQGTQGDTDLAGTVGSLSQYSLAHSDPKENHRRLMTRAVAVKSIMDIHKTMQAMSDGQRGIEAVSQPSEIVELISYVSQRVELFLSGTFPAEPKLLQASQSLIASATQKIPQVPQSPSAVSGAKSSTQPADASLTPRQGNLPSNTVSSQPQSTPRSAGVDSLLPAISPRNGPKLTVIQFPGSTPITAADP